MNTAGLREPQTALEDKNRFMKWMLSDLSMQADLLREAIEKSEAAKSVPRACRQGGGEEGG